MTRTMNGGRGRGDRNRRSRLLPFVKVPAAPVVAGRNKACLSCSFTIPSVSPLFTVCARNNIERKRELE